ncbi:nitronate monooxygenase [Allopseudospirillum japonicum]|uniref:Nitronate monooxygenase n=1 Tax=Allopseudospirillum japonicum TaxID=64971 RepID=A0A1H6RKX4_9GAMM|nr:nitronate monooxygenase [Allopseudospirillum japonicum]SEI51832.1 nitronate monooxygenase [Allopseudospirillum japonicum]
MAQGRFQQDFAVDLPLIQAPMAGVQDAALALAVNQAGGLGSLPCAMLDLETLVSELTHLKAHTCRPVNLNFFCHQVPAYDPHQQTQWRQRLQPYFDELGITSNTLPTGASRIPFDHQVANAIEPFQPAIISFHFGLPEPSLLQRVKTWGTKILASATTVAEALWLESQGVDAIIAQGLEAGGHRGMFLSTDLNTQMGLFALLPQIVAQVQVPVIAAGGISDAQGVQAALTLGADAVQVGSAYLLCTEAKTSALHKAAIQSPRAHKTAITCIFSGKPARGIVNRAMQEIGTMPNQVPAFPYASIEMGALRSQAETLGLDDFTPLWCGQNTSGCAPISATELTLRLAGLA